jgi:hypothetical protein
LCFVKIRRVEEGRRLKERPLWKKEKPQEGGREMEKGAKKDVEVGGCCKKVSNCLPISHPALDSISTQGSTRHHREKAHRQACPSPLHPSQRNWFRISQLTSTVETGLCETLC